MPPTAPVSSSGSLPAVGLAWRSRDSYGAGSLLLVQVFALSVLFSLALWYLIPLLVVTALVFLELVCLFGCLFVCLCVCSGCVLVCLFACFVWLCLFACSLGGVLVCLLVCLLVGCSSDWLLVDLFVCWLSCFACLFCLCYCFCFVGSLFPQRSKLTWRAAVDMHMLSARACATRGLACTSPQRYREYCW